MREKTEDVDLGDARIQRILEQLVRDGPMNAYQLEKASDFAHSTSYGILQRLIKLGYVELTSKERFRTGLPTKYYRISAGGFFELMNAVDPNDQLRRNLPDILVQDPRFCPWLSEQVRLMKSIEAGNLMRRYVDACVPLIQASGEPLSAPGPESSYLRGITALLLEILSPQIDAHSFGFWSHHSFPHPPLAEKAGKKELESLQQEVRRYLSLREDILSYIEDRLKQTQEWLETEQTVFAKVRASLK